MNKERKCFKILKTQRKHRTAYFRHVSTQWQRGYLLFYVGNTFPEDFAKETSFTLLLFNSRSLMFPRVSDDVYPILLETIIALLHSVKV